MEKLWFYWQQSSNVYIAEQRKTLFTGWRGALPVRGVTLLIGEWKKEERLSIWKHGVLKARVILLRIYSTANPAAIVA